jgi:putative oxidoreductase
LLVARKAYGLQYCWTESGNAGLAHEPAKNWVAIMSAQIRSVLRIVTALLFLQHGSAKLLHAPYQPMFAHLQLASLLGVQGVIELVGGVLLAIGLFSRPVAFILCGDMAVAFFMAHFPKSWLPIVNGGDLAVLFCFTFLYLCVAGPGPWSVDAMLSARKRGT